MMEIIVISKLDVYYTHHTNIRHTYNIITYYYDIR